MIHSKFEERKQTGTEAAWKLSKITGIYSNDGK
jgi:hypothetical protein